MSTLAKIPQKLAPFLTEKRRYKVGYGGRGGAKSHTVAQALLILGAQSCLRILCAREIQKSIRDSVHRLLSDKIAALNLDSFYEITDNEIRGANGTLIIFRGLRNETMDSIKSLEGIDICWIEEAHSVSQRSLDILLPTIRKDGSEVWFTYNPELDTDPVHLRFVVNTDPDAWVVKVSIHDNPWASQTLINECRNAYLTDPLKAAWIWGGQCRPSAEGAIYAQELAIMTAENRICRIPWNRSLDTIVSMDLGWGDHTSVVVGQHVQRERHIIAAYENSQESISHYIDWIKQLPYRVDHFALPHDAAAHSLQTAQSISDKVKAAFPTAQVHLVGRDEDGKKVDLESGIDYVRECFSSTWIDERCTTLLQALRKYRRRKDAHTGAFCEPMHDTYSDMSDAFRYWHMFVPPRPKTQNPAALNKRITLINTR